MAQKAQLPAAVRLEGAVQQYAWGVEGRASLVHRLAAAGGMQLADHGPYAELWLGTHPRGPARLQACGTPLAAWRLAHEEAAASPPPSASPSSYPGAAGLPAGGLPFLCKVLAIARPLSIQVHPDRAAAAALHAARPEVYRDANHKPELACALGPFEALCGFRPLAAALALARAHAPELCAAVPEALAAAAAAAAGDEAAQEKGRRALFAALVAPARGAALSAAAAALGARLRREGEGRRLAPLEALAARVEAAFPADVGVLLLFLLRHHRLEAGQALYLGAGVPHAYLSGACVEVMACSDNVVRAGLTPKLRDAATLLRLLDASAAPPQVLGGGGGGVQELLPAGQPLPREFRLARAALAAGEEAALPLQAGAPALLIVVEGGGELRRPCAPAVALAEGTLLYAPPGPPPRLLAGPAGLLLFSCSCDPEACV